MSSLEVYLVVLSGRLSMFFGMLGIIAMMLTAIYAIENYISKPEEFSRCLGLIKKAGIGIICCGFIATVLPNTTQMAAIYIIPKIVNNTEISKLPPELTSLAVEWLKDIKKTK